MTTEAETEEHKPNGAFTPEQQQDMIEQIIASRIAPFARHLPADQLTALAKDLVAEDNMLGEQVLPKVIDFGERPFWYLDVRLPGTSKGLRIHTLKNLAQINDVPEAERVNMFIHHLLLLALTTDGLTARGVMRAFGAQYGFGEMVQKEVAPRIVVPR